MTKVEEARNYFNQGKVKEALRIAKDFRIGTTKEDRSVMARAYECIVHPDFYLSINVDIEKAIEFGVEVLKNI